jgi:hypothetical protein
MGFTIDIAVPEERFSSGEFEQLLSDVFAEKGFATFGFLDCKSGVREALYENGDASREIKVTCQSGVDVRYGGDRATPTVDKSSNIARAEVGGTFSNDRQLAERFARAFCDEIHGGGEVYSISVY